MTQVRRGDMVRVHYTGKFADGTVFEKPIEDQPLQFTTGKSGSITDLEQAVAGMAPGKSKAIRIVDRVLDSRLRKGTT